MGLCDKVASLLLWPLGVPGTATAAADMGAMAARHPSNLLAKSLLAPDEVNGETLFLQSCAALVASLLPRLLQAPSEAVAVARMGVVEAMREAMGGFMSQDLEALIPSGASLLQGSSIVRVAQMPACPRVP